MCCGYSLEMPRCGISNVYPQHMFSWRCKKNINTFVLKKNLIISYESGDVFSAAMYLSSVIAVVVVFFFFFFFFFFFEVENSKCLKIKLYIGIRFSVCLSTFLSTLRIVPFLNNYHLQASNLANMFSVKLCYIS